MPLILAPRRMSGMGDDGYKAPFQDEMVRIVHSFNGNKGVHGREHPAGSRVGGDLLHRRPLTR